MRKRVSTKRTRKLVHDVTRPNSELINTLINHDDIASAWYFNGSVFGKLKSNERRLKFDILDDIDKKVKFFMKWYIPLSSTCVCVFPFFLNWITLCMCIFPEPLGAVLFILAFFRNFLCRSSNGFTIRISQVTSGVVFLHGTKLHTSVLGTIGSILLC